MSRPVIDVWHVLYDVDGPGDMGDGLRTYRTTDAESAKRFAVGKTCWGNPASASAQEVSRTLFNRWKREGKVSA